MKTTTTLIMAALLAINLSLTAQEMPVKTPDSARLNEHVNSLNELTERRRVSTFFKNQQPLRYGMAKGFVNTSSGNLTFTRRDMVLTGRTPIIIARVYDSSRSDKADFGQGFYLTLSQNITEQTDGSLLYFDESAAAVKLLPAATGYTVAQVQSSNITAIVRLSTMALQVRYGTGWYKTFEKVGSRYRLSELGDGFGNNIVLRYDNGLLGRVDGQNGRQVLFARNKQGRITKVSDENNRSVSYKYNNKGQLSGITDMGGEQWHYQYAAHGRLKKVTDPQGQRTSSFHYDNHGRVTKSQVRATKYDYHYAQGITTVTSEAGKSTVFEHNENGITTVVTNAAGSTSSVELNSHNQVTKLYHDAKLTTQLSYNDKGKISQLQRRSDEGEFELLSYQYDKKDRMVGVLQDGKTISQYVFNDKGQPLQIISGNINRTYSYAPNGDTLTQTDGNVKYAYQYNVHGELTTLIENGAKAVFSYSKAGRLIGVTFPDGASHQYQYNKLGFRSLTQRSDNSSIRYNYDSIGNFSGSINTNSEGHAQQTEIKLGQGNKVDEFIIDGKQVLDISYSDENNPTTIKYDGKSVDYRYDSLGRLTGVADGLGPLMYQYQQGEKDLRVQRDDRTAPIYSASGSPFGLTSMYTRSMGTLWQNIAWNETLGTIELPAALGHLSPDSRFQSANQRRRLYDAVAIVKQRQRRFDKPSSSFFLPMEYSAINCYPEDCWIYGVTLGGSGTATVGQATQFSATTFSGFNCDPSYSFDVDGSFIGTNSSGSFQHVFTSSGPHQVGVSAVCQCRPWKFPYSDVQTINVECENTANLVGFTTAPLAASVDYKINKVSVPSGTSDTRWGGTRPNENDVLIVDIMVYLDQDKNVWRPVITTAISYVDMWYRLLNARPGMGVYSAVKEATLGEAQADPQMCPKIMQDLSLYGPADALYYLLKAVETHERVHFAEWKEIMDKHFAELQSRLTQTLTVNHHCDMTAFIAKLIMKADPNYWQSIEDTIKSALVDWNKGGEDHARNRAAVKPVVDGTLNLLATQGPSQCR